MLGTKNLSKMTLFTLNAVLSLNEQKSIFIFELLLLAKIIPFSFNIIIRNTFKIILRMIINNYITNPLLKDI